MLKQKTFIFNGYDVGIFNAGKIHFDSNVINEKIDNFLKDKELVTINTTTFTRGNNPPTAGIVYTVIYRIEE